jgi:succinate-acetate transporter protein
MWGIFTALMFFGTLRTNVATMFVFGSLAILFLILGMGDLTGNADITHLGGWEGLVVGFSAMYTAIALVLNESFGRTILPIFPVKTLSDANKLKGMDEI